MHAPDRLNRSSSVRPLGGPILIAPGFCRAVDEAPAGRVGGEASQESAKYTADLSPDLSQFLTKYHYFSGEVHIKRHNRLGVPGIRGRFRCGA